MTSHITHAAAAVAALGDFDALDDAQLVSAQRLLATLAVEVDALQARCAAVIARRSDPSLGLSGLARRHGFVNAESFVQSITGGTKADATKLVRVGGMSTSEAPWQQTVGRHLANTGGVSVDAANAIRLGLESSQAPEERVVAAAEKLLADAASVDADELARRARAARERLDAESIARDEAQRREQRYFAAKRGADGVVRGSFALSDEDGALILSIYQQATSPRAFGPQFVDTATHAEPDSLPNDPRSRGQKAADAFAGLLRIGAEADDHQVLGLHRPSVRIHVAAETIARRAGYGVIEDANDFPISFETVERHLCASGVIGIAFDDDGQSLNVGREQRLHTAKQRIALAARDGGCRFPACDRPLSWTEAHHVDYWGRDEGETSIENGICLCRLHHLLVHDNHWVIRRDGGDYWLTPPPDIDPTQTPVLIPSKQPLVRELQRAG
jgi:hypothetical protein